MAETLPPTICDIVGSERCIKNDVGMSDSEVYEFPDYVLKVQKHTAESDNEYAIVRWLNKRLPVPEIPVYTVRDGTAYTLMTRARGRMLCDMQFMNEPELLIKAACEGLRLLWSVDISDCPCTVSRLSQRLAAARYNVEHGLVDTDNVEPDTFGPKGFADPAQLLRWLEEHRPDEELVMTHGDYCLPNIFADDKGICSFIDLGKAGPADRWQDIAICLRSLRSNFNGRYNGGKKIPGYDENAFLRELGIERNEEKMRYYLLLDELF